MIRARPLAYSAALIGVVTASLACESTLVGTTDGQPADAGTLDGSSQTDANVDHEPDTDAALDQGGTSPDNGAP